jgi:hypothetical protein
MLEQSLREKPDMKRFLLTFVLAAYLVGLTSGLERPRELSAPTEVTVFCFTINSVTPECTRILRWNTPLGFLCFLGHVTWAVVQEALKWVQMYDLWKKLYPPAAIR